MFLKAISYAEETHYTQVKAKALSGIAELYRVRGEFETALSHHLKAIELLEEIGANPDLAEAYYQLGLTYQRWVKPKIAGRISIKLINYSAK
jgi:tetratricopeptide (TPR) repeat protein